MREKANLLLNTVKKRGYVQIYTIFINLTAPHPILPRAGEGIGLGANVNLVQSCI